MGFETLTVGRISEAEHKKRKDDKSLEFYWLPSFEAENGKSFKGNTPGLFTHVMHEKMGDAPCGLGTAGEDFKVKRDAENYFLDKLNQITLYPMKTMACLYDYALNYKTKNLLFPAGSDFSFKYAEAHLNFLERVITMLHGKPISLENKPTVQFRFKFSSLSTYFKELRLEAKAKKITYPTYERNDFLPLTGLDNLGDPYYITGKYSHRPLFKQHISAFSSIFQNSLTFYAFDIINQKGMKPLSA